MINMSKKPLLHLLICSVFMMLILSFSVMAQEDVEKKYAPILGDYEFDMSHAGMGIVTVQIYIENETLWAWPDMSSNPASLKPVKGAEFMFVIEDPDEGTYELVFMKDDNGEYTKCHVINSQMGMDVVGEKIKK
jgi:hypothetical protein